jgi:hypothetical protein
MATLHSHFIIHSNQSSMDPTPTREALLLQVALLSIENKMLSMQIFEYDELNRLGPCRAEIVPPPPYSDIVPPYTEIAPLRASKTQLEVKDNVRATPSRLCISGTMNVLVLMALVFALMVTVTPATSYLSIGTK